ncbi:MAG TPA: type II toxin-antitoxin system Phd/YefM family antitoxin [Gammaproteobacteria bacterium]|jgi:prevent-host-death family protein|nr:type II toxin-antitoxin system Phd/YefM family antitoxin [Gammaproteobacteria bacterium]
MRTVNIHDAKTHFSQLVDTVMQGKTIIIAKAGKPAAKLCPITPSQPKRRFGVLKGKIMIADDFDAPLPDDLLSDFEN